MRREKRPIYTNSRNIWIAFVLANKSHINIWPKRAAWRVPKLEPAKVVLERLPSAEWRSLDIILNRTSFLPSSSLKKNQCTRFDSHFHLHWPQLGFDHFDHFGSHSGNLWGQFLATFSLNLWPNQIPERFLMHNSHSGPLKAKLHLLSSSLSQKSAQTE